MGIKPGSEHKEAVGRSRGLPKIKPKSRVRLLEGRNPVKKTFFCGDRKWFRSETFYRALFEQREVTQSLQTNPTEFWSARHRHDFGPKYNDRTVNGLSELNFCCEMFHFLLWRRYC